jgi:hypothetical protein
VLGALEVGVERDRADIGVVEGGDEAVEVVVPAGSDAGDQVGAPSGVSGTTWVKVSVVTPSDSSSSRVCCQASFGPEPSAEKAAASRLRTTKRRGGSQASTR